MIKGIKFCSIAARNQDTTLKFFRDKLGFRVLTDQAFNDQQRWIELGLQGSDTRLVLFTPPGQEAAVGGFANVTFYADNVEQTYAELQAKGVEFLAPPQKQDWGTSVIFKDPDGTQFVISSR